MKNLFVKVFILFSFYSFSQNIDDYFKIAAEQNPDLLAIYKDFEIAMERVDQVSALSDPTLSFGYFISPIETRLGSKKAEFSLSQMFPWFGTLKARGDVALLSAEAKFQTYINARNKIYYNVAKSYYPLYEINRLIYIENKNVKLLESYKSVAISHFQNNKGSMVDVLRVDIVKRDSEISLKLLKEKKRFFSARFNPVPDRDQESPINILDTITAEVTSFEYEKETFDKKHPLLQELDLKLQESKAQERVISKEGLPRLGISVDYMIVDSYPNETNLSDNGKDALMPMLRMSLPIFRSKYKAAKRQVHLNQQAYTLRKKNVTNTLRTSYERVRFEIDKQKELINLYDYQMAESKQSLDLLFVAYSNSGNDFEEVLRMEQQLLNYQKLKVRALNSYMVSLAEMDYVNAKSKK